MEHNSMINIALEVECPPGLHYNASLFIGPSERHICFAVR